MVLVPFVLLAALVLGLWASLVGLGGRPPGRGLLRGLLGLQLLLFAQAGVALLQLDPGESTASFVGYLVVSVLLLPGAFALTVEERTRWGSLVLAAACLVVAVVELRLVATA
ncbi:MAG: hypothetical protein JWN57_927 [Frankiales bacterium]|nr:hypothetical protein [Frankiales bacterium]